MSIDAIIKIQGLYIEQPLRIETDHGNFFIFSPLCMEKYQEYQSKKDGILASNADVQISYNSNGTYNPPNKDQEGSIFVGKIVDLDPKKDIPQLYQEIYNEFRAFFVSIDFIFT